MTRIFHLSVGLSSVGPVRAYSDKHITNITKSGATRLKDIKLECGPMPNVMVALPNIGGALCSTPQSLANAHY